MQPPHQRTGLWAMPNVNEPAWYEGTEEPLPSTHTHPLVPESYRFKRQHTMAQRSRVAPCGWLLIRPSQIGRGYLWVSSLKTPSPQRAGRNQSPHPTCGISHSHSLGSLRIRKPPHCKQVKHSNTFILQLLQYIQHTTTTCYYIRLSPYWRNHYDTPLNTLKTP